MPSYLSRIGRFWRAPGLLAVLLLALAGAGCNTVKKIASPEEPKYFAQFFMEAPPGSGVEFTLPVSGLKYHRMPRPFLTAADVQWVQAGTVDVRGTKTLCVFFQFNIQGKHELYLQTAANISRRIFLFANDKPMGVRYIDEPVDSGQLFIFAETENDKKFEEFLTDLQNSQQQIAELKKR